MLAYSSIAQAGYLILGIATMGFSPAITYMGQSGVLFFLAGYTVTNLGAFIAVIAISEKVGSDRISDYDGMGKRAPMISLALTLCLISLTGIPPTAGFMAKFYIFSSAVQHDLLWLVFFLHGWAAVREELNRELYADCHTQPGRQSAAGRLT